MRKFLIIPLALAVSIGFAACGGTTTKVKTVTVADRGGTPPATTTATTPAVPACSTEDATDDSGDAACSLGTSTYCPSGWYDNANDASQCVPYTSDSTDPTDTNGGGPTSDSSSDSSDLTGPVGTAFTDTDDSNNVMAVKLTLVMDPAHSDNEFDTADNGNRYVAVKFKITGVSGSYQDDANSDAVVIGSDGQSYTFDTADVEGCTNFNYGDFTVTPGRSEIGCVVFQVPDGVKVASVQWGGEFGGTPATWDVKK